MKQEEFIKTFNICGTKVDLGLDDYGQCYFIEWEEDGEKKEMGLGTYCFDYLEQIYYLFDLRYQELSKKDLYGELTDAEWNELNEYNKTFEEEYKR